MSPRRNFDLPRPVLRALNPLLRSVDVLATFCLLLGSVCMWPSCIVVVPGNQAVKWLREGDQLKQRCENERCRTLRAKLNTMYLMEHHSYTDDGRCLS